MKVIIITKFQVEYRELEEKFNPAEDENVSDNSEKSKTGQGTPEKKSSADAKKDSETNASSSGVKAEVKEEQESDHEDPHSKIFIKIKLFI